MGKINSIAELVAAVKANPVVIQQLPVELVLSFPIPTHYSDRFLIAFMYFNKVGVPPAPPKVYPPCYWLFVDPETEKIVELTTVKPEGVQITYTPNKSLGEHKLSPPLSMSEYQKKKVELYQLYDRIIILYKTAKVSPSEKEEQTVQQFVTIFNELVEKPLLPFYRALNPDFFSWLEKFGVKK